MKQTDVEASNAELSKKIKQKKKNSRSPSKSLNSLIPQFQIKNGVTEVNKFITEKKKD